MDIILAVCTGINFVFFCANTIRAVKLSKIVSCGTIEEQEVKQ